MSQILPASVTKAIEAFKLLPGVGQRSAERYVYALLKTTQSDARQLADSLANLHQGIHYCPKTFALIEANQKLSSLYSDAERDKTTLAVVASPFDILAIERTASFKGTYHVLGGLLSPIDGVGADQLHLVELKQRLKVDKVKEVIFAFNASVEAESTALLLRQSLSGVKFSRLAQGLPIGVDLEYADSLTLSRALTNRQKL